MDCNAMVVKIRQDQSGATLIEYALIIALIALGMMVGLNSFADSTNQMWEFIRTNVLNGLGA
jgi:Flp pilus assembly pilin Flp